MPENRESGFLVAFEAIAAVGVAFVGASLLAAVAFVGTAAFVEEDGMAGLYATSKKISVQLEPADTGEPPSGAETVDVVRKAVPGAEVIVVPEGLHTRTLAAWVGDDVPYAVVGTIADELERLGWRDPQPSIVVQRGFETALENPKRMKKYLPLLILVQALVFMLAAWALLLWRKPRRPGSKDYTPTRLFGGMLGRLPRTPVGWGVASAFVAFVCSSIIGVTLSVLGLEIREQGWIQALIADKPVLLGLSPFIVLVGPISEEVFFRGYVFRRVNAASGPVLAYVLSAVLFAAVHFHPVGVPMYVVIGLIFCWVYRHTGSLWAPIVGHVVYNGIVVLISYLAPAAT